MPVVQWIAHVLRATSWLALHLAIVTGLFLLSAHLGRQPGEDERNAGLFVRGLASFWLYIAAWSWLVRGIFKRPAPPPVKGTPTGAAVARSSLGCLANLAPIPFVFVFVGRFADWAWAGIAGSDPTHPARRAADLVQNRLLYVVDHTDGWIPAVAVLIFMYQAGKAIMKTSRKRRRTTAWQAQGTNQATLEKLRQKGSKPGHAAARPIPKGREILAAAGIPSAQTVVAAHAGAHGRQVSGATRGSAREDRVLGALTFSSSDGGWSAHRDDGGFPVHMAGGSDGPDAHAVDLGRQAIQRSFEVLLRASDAARPIAQSRGVGLPRFTIAAVRVGAGTTPDVAVHLRCDTDPGHDYVVRSTDKLQTFKAG